MYESIAENLKASLDAACTRCAVNGQLSLVGLNNVLLALADADDGIDIPDLTEWLTDYTEIPTDEIRIDVAEIIVSDDLPPQILFPIDDFLSVLYSYDGVIGDDLTRLPKVSVNPAIIALQEPIATMSVLGTPEYVLPIAETVHDGVVLVLKDLDDDSDYEGEYAALGLAVVVGEYLSVSFIDGRMEIETTDINLLRNLLLEQVIGGYELKENITPKIVNAERRVAICYDKDRPVYAKSFYMNLKDLTVKRER